MTGLLDRPETDERRDRPVPPPSPEGGGGPPTAASDDLLLLCVLALLATASLSFGRVFTGWDFVPSVGGALVVALGLSWGTRRLGAGPVLSLLANVLAWLAFVAAAFVPASTLAGIVPTPATLSDLRLLWGHGIELIRATPAPVVASPGVLVFAVTGVWAVAHVVDALAFRLRAPVKAIGVALVLWAVPLAVAPDSVAAWTGAAPFLAASALVLLAFAGTGLRRWGAWVKPPRSRSAAAVGRRKPTSLASLGVALAGVAIAVGSAAAGVLPGFDEQPWYEVQGTGGGTTLTTNPIVDIQAKLVSLDDTPLLHVETERPVYLRLTSLSRYRDGQWGSNDIQAREVIPGEPLGFEQHIADRAQTPVEVELEVANLSDAVLVPAPYQPTEVVRTDTALRYDPRLSTLTALNGLQPGDRYTVRAAVPDPGLADVSGVHTPVGGAPDHYTQLPEVPALVEDTARRIVAEAGAASVYEKALAIQQELRSWEYSLDPRWGHGPDAMTAFITQKVGYCEQYAGTMAVMLRTLGIPARVAVGFTPGQKIGENTYEVTNANAHAWVEVLFPEAGWVTFEPTPRDDGNVLVPSAQNPSPRQTQAQQGTEAGSGSDSGGQEETSPPPPEPSPTPQPEPDPAGGGTGGGVRALGWLALAAVLGLLAVAGGLTLWRRGQARAPRTPLERVLQAWREVERVGRGLGRGPVPWETEQEYLERLSGPSDDTAALAAVTARARYAPTLDEQAAAEAEASGRRLRTRLLAGLSAPRRRLVLARADAAAAATALTAGVRRIRLRRA